MTSGVTKSVAEILAWMRARESRRNQAGMARYGIVAANGKVFGITMDALRGLAKGIGRDHALAAALWRSGWHEARLLAAFVDEPARVTVAQMDRWARDFDNWAICDSVCIHLLSRTPHAWGRVRAWAASPDEFVRRAAFALVAALAVHDRAAPDAKFRSALRLVERHAADPRNFVKKAASWALRATGNRSRALHADALALATRLAASPDAARRWVGRDARRDLSRPIVRQRLARCEAGRRADPRRARPGKRNNPNALDP